MGVDPDRSRCWPRGRSDWLWSLLHLHFDRIRWEIAFGVSSESDSFTEVLVAEAVTTAKENRIRSPRPFSNQSATVVIAG